jgi:uncharacterized DUF497 family protein
MKKTNFEWDEKKEQLNCEKHGVSFYEAQKAFLGNSSAPKNIQLQFYRNIVNFAALKLVKDFIF